MKRVPLFYKTDEQSRDLVMSTRTDSFGNVWHCVEYQNGDGTPDYAFFKNLSSALDFVQSNFL